MFKICLYSEVFPPPPELRLSHSPVLTALGCRYYSFSHFTDEEIEAWERLSTKGPFIISDGERAQAPACFLVFGNLGVCNVINSASVEHLFVTTLCEETIQ